MTVPRFPRGLYARGQEPDPRFSLANERTFLAWIRTGLAFGAGAVALEALDIPEQAFLRLPAALTLVTVACIAVLQAWFGWHRAERAMRLGAPLPAPVSALPVSVGLLIVLLLVGSGLLAGRL